MFASNHSARACVHLANFPTTNGPSTSAAESSKKQAASLLNSYRAAVRWTETYKRRDALKELGTKKRSLPDSLPIQKCSTCQDALGRLHACAQCVFVGCWRQGHMKQHMKETGHQFATDLVHSQLYCGGCSDYVYDNQFEAAKNLELTRMAELMEGKSARPNKRARFVTYNPNEKESEAIRNASTASSCTGLRGLRNIGNTCFMNVILQAMVHNPLLRSYFLGDRHNRRLCNAMTTKKKTCMACEMDKLFSEFFSGESKPFGPCSFLYSVWQSADELAGYKQHDAHEFFISVLNQIHLNQSENPNQSTTCRCIVHQTFSGIFQSDVTCLRCGNVTTANDPFLDISLDIRSGLKRKRGHAASSASENASSGPDAKRKKGSTPTPSSNEVIESGSETPPNSLLDCLDR